MKTFLISALALGAMSTAAVADSVAPTVAPEDDALTGRTGPVELTDIQMDAITAGAEAIVEPTLRDQRIGVQVVNVPRKAIDRSRALQPNDVVTVDAIDVGDPVRF